MVFGRKKKESKVIDPKKYDLKEPEDEEPTDEFEEEPEEEPEPKVIPRRPMKKVKERTQIVKELPMQPVRRFRDEEGNIVNLITVEEALTEWYSE